MNPMDMLPQLVHISGKGSDATTFQIQLKSSSLHLGGAKHLKPMTPTSRWCAERGCDPISGSFLDVANFLADLHSQGYHTSSLNGYRSAISGVHDRVDCM